MSPEVVQYIAWCFVDHLFFVDMVKASHRHWPRLGLQGGWPWPRFGSGLLIGPPYWHDWSILLNYFGENINIQCHSLTLGMEAEWPVARWLWSIGPGILLVTPPPPPPHKYTATHGNDPWWSPWIYSRPQPRTLLWTKFQGFFTRVTRKNRVCFL